MLGTSDIVSLSLHSGSYSLFTKLRKLTKYLRKYGKGSRCFWELVFLIQSEESKGISSRIQRKKINLMPQYLFLSQLETMERKRTVLEAFDISCIQICVAVQGWHVGRTYNSWLHPPLVFGFSSATEAEYLARGVYCLTWEIMSILKSFIYLGVILCLTFLPFPPCYLSSFNWSRKWSKALCYYTIRVSSHHQLNSFLI